MFVEVERIEPADWGDAVASTDGPQLVVSGPGAGKTEFLVRRALYLIEHRGVGPDSLLLLSFSRRSAGDLRRRIELGLEGSYTEVSSSTFHGLAARVLERYGPQVLGWDRVPALLTAPEHVELVHRLLASENEAAWPVLYRPMLATITFAEEVADFVLRCRELLIDPEALAGRIEKRPQWRGLDGFLARYDEHLESVGRIDYGTLQARATEVMSDPEVGADLTSRHPYILVDELQDTTRVQARMLQLLYRGHHNLTVTGDPYQSIYGFRGADPSNLTEFATSFPDAQGRPAAQLALTQSFRVRSDVLRAAERITSGGALPEVAGPVDPAPGPSSVEAYRFTQQSEEAEWIAAEVERVHLVEGLPYSRMAVLVRTKRRLLSELSRALERRGIPHDRPDIRSLDQPAVRVVADIVLAACGGARQGAEALQRLLLGPLYAVTLGRWRELQREAARLGTGWARLLRSQLPEASDLADSIEDPSWATTLPAAQGFWQLWSGLDRFEAVATSHDPGWRRALSSLSQVLERLSERDPEMTLETYVKMLEREDFEAVPLLGYSPPDEDRLTLTTMHQAKGLEFDVVLIADAVEGVLPDLRPRDSYLDTRLLDPRQSEEPAVYALSRLREEMRLAYTAMCRATSRVVWTATAAGVAEDHGPPSRFVAAAIGTDTVTEALSPAPTAGAPITPAARLAAARRAIRDVAASDVERLAALGAVAAGGSLPELAHGALEPGPDSGLVPSAMSPSQAEAYDTCPRRYVLERRLGLGESETVYLLFGSLIHDVLESTERAALDRGDHHGSGDEALGHLDRLFDPADFGGEPWATAWRRRAVDCLDRLYGSWPPDSLAVHDVERSFQLEIGNGSWVGRADRIEAGDGQIRIVDYKTSRSPKPKKEGERSLQLAFYALAAQHDAALDGSVTAAELWFPAAQRKSVSTVGLDLGILDELEARLEEVAVAISHERWDPTPGSHCDRCRMRPLCPAWPEGGEAFA